MARIKIEDLPRDKEVTRKEMAAITGGGSLFQAMVVDSLNSVDQQNMDLLDQVISAADEMSDPIGGVSTSAGGSHGTGGITWGGLPRWRLVSTSSSK